VEPEVLEDEDGMAGGDLGEQIRQLKAEGETILLAEQNAGFALGLSDRAYVIDKGAICYTGTAAGILDDETIRRDYLAV